MNAKTRTDSQPGSSVGRVASEPTVLHVDNRNFSSQHVYAVTMKGRRAPLGGRDDVVVVRCFEPLDRRLLR